MPQSAGSAHTQAWQFFGSAVTPCRAASRSTSTPTATGGRLIRHETRSSSRAGCCPVSSTAHTHPGAENPGDPLDEAVLREDLHRHVDAGVTVSGPRASPATRPRGSARIPTCHGPGTPVLGWRSTASSSTAGVVVSDPRRDAGRRRRAGRPHRLGQGHRRLGSRRRGVPVDVLRTVVDGRARCRRPRRGPHPAGRRRSRGRRRRGRLHRARHVPRPAPCTPWPPRAASSRPRSPSSPPASTGSAPPSPAPAATGTSTARRPTAPWPAPPSKPASPSSPAPIPARMGGLRTRYGHSPRPAYRCQLLWALRRGRQGRTWGSAASSRGQ